MSKCSVCILLLFVFIFSCHGDKEDYNLIGVAICGGYSITINVGHPPQQLNLLVDTGSATLAIASATQNLDKYFNPKNSTSFHDSGKEVQTKYTQGMWVGHLVSDYVRVPSLPNVPEVRTNLGLITKSDKFFNTGGTGWHGLLGLAYMPVGAWGESVIVESWMDSLERVTNQPVAFQLKLCGLINNYDNQYAGYFKIIDESPHDTNRSFTTQILKKRWYEVGILGIRVLHNETNDTSKHKTISNDSDTQNIVANDNMGDIDQEMCRTLTKEKSIVDSGTTCIKIPDVYFRKIVDEIKSIVESSNIFVFDGFWYRIETACWPEPQHWPLPNLAVDLLDDSDDKLYYTLVIPPKSYMRLISVNHSANGSVPEYCYKFGLEAGGTTTVLGYTALEGFDLVFNRTAGYISWQKSDCGPDTRITGPHNVTKSLITYCDLTKIVIDTEVSIRAAQWALCVVSVVAFVVLVYLLAPCVKIVCFKKRIPTSPQMSMSQAALVNQHDNT